MNNKSSQKTRRGAKKLKQLLLANYIPTNYAPGNDASTNALKGLGNITKAVGQVNGQNYSQLTNALTTNAATQATGAAALEQDQQSAAFQSLGGNLLANGGTGAGGTIPGLGTDNTTLGTG